MTEFHGCATEGLRSRDGAYERRTCLGDRGEKMIVESSPDRWWNEFRRLIDQRRKSRTTVAIAICIAIVFQSAPTSATPSPGGWARFRTGVVSIADAIELGVRIERIESAPNPDADNRAKKLAAIDTYLRHLYSVSLGLRACFEISAEQKDQSFVPSVSLDEARETLKLVGAAATEVNIDFSAAWSAASPRAATAALALKQQAATHLEYCRKMGSLFRIDASNLQSLLYSLGAKTIILFKDY